LISRDRLDKSDFRGYTFGERRKDVVGSMKELVCILFLVCVYLYCKLEKLDCRISELENDKE
jgi:hypothetical protein